MTNDSLTATDEVQNRRRKERREKGDRRKIETLILQGDSERRQGERRAKVERRRQIDPTTCERDYTDEQVEFMSAMDLYKRRSGRQFPTWSEVLEVLQNLGYRKVAPPTEIYRQP